MANASPSSRWGSNVTYIPPAHIMGFALGVTQIIGFALGVTQILGFVLAP